MDFETFRTRYFGVELDLPTVPWQQDLANRVADALEEQAGVCCSLPPRLH